MTLSTPASSAQPIRRFTTQFSSQPPSACSTATSTAWPHGSRSDPDIYREIGKQTASLGYARRDWKKPLESVTAK